MQRQLDELKKRRATQSGTAKTAGTGATILAESDAPCVLRVDGEVVATLRALTPQRISVDTGKLLVDCSSSDFPEIRISEVLELSRGSKEVYKVYLAEKVQAMRSKQRRESEEQAHRADEEAKAHTKRIEALALLGSKPWAGYCRIYRARSRGNDLDLETKLSVQFDRVANGQSLVGVLRFDRVDKSDPYRQSASTTVVDSLSLVEVGPGKFSLKRPGFTSYDLELRSTSEGKYLWFADKHGDCDRPAWWRLY